MKYRYFMLPFIIIVLMILVIDYNSEIVNKVLIDRSGASERARIEHSDPPVRSGPFGLGIAIIPHADLHELAHLRQVAQYVEHDRSVRKFESLVRLTQVAMGITLLKLNLMKIEKKIGLIVIYLLIYIWK